MFDNVTFCEMDVLICFCCCFVRFKKKVPVLTLNSRNVLQATTLDLAIIIGAR